MKEPAWLVAAKALPAGRSNKIAHCATDRSCIVSNEKHGYRAHCFRCGPVGFVKHELFSIGQLARRKQELELLAERETKLPKDFTTDIPASEAIWLYKAGVSHAIARHYGFGYSASLRRVILPVYENKKLMGFTARSTIGEKPKYIERMVPEAIFRADPAVGLASEAGWREAVGPDLVLVEDILSAVRVGRVVRQACSVLGTSVSYLQTHSILAGQSKGLRIAVWLDPDKAGVTGAFRLVRSLAVMGHDVQQIKTKKDPKYYSNREIREWLTLT
jgi:hypothetical protein